MHCFIRLKKHDICLKIPNTNTLAKYLTNILTFAKFKVNFVAKILLKTEINQIEMLESRT